MKQLVIKIVTDAKDAAKGIGETETRLKKLGKTAGVAAATGVAALGAGLGVIAVAGVKDAARLEQSIGAISSVFKKSAGQMNKWSKTAARDVGLTRNEFNELGTIIGAQLKNGGTAMDELAPKTKKLITQGADLAAMFGGTTREAIESISSALRGESEPIEKYGVTLTQAKVDAEAAALGFKKVGGVFDQQAKQAATLSLITKGTADSIGTFAREQDTAAGAAAILAAEWSNLRTEIGTMLLPILTTFVTWLRDTGLPALKTFIDTIRGDGSGTAGLIEKLRLAELRDMLVKLWPKLVAFGEAVGPKLAGCGFESHGAHRPSFKPCAANTGTGRWLPDQPPFWATPAPSGCSTPS